MEVSRCPVSSLGRSPASLALLLTAGLASCTDGPTGSGSGGGTTGGLTGSSSGGATVSGSDTGTSVLPSTTEVASGSEGDGQSTGGSSGGGAEACVGPFTELEQSLIDMPADSWMRVPMGYGEYCDDTFELEWHAVIGCAALIGAWSSGVWDPSARQMLIWGGGHADYAGNEVYAFDTATFSWSALTTPSPGPYDRDPLDDGQPVSRHTYDGLTWMSDDEAMFAWGGSIAMGGGGTDITWRFDPGSTTWTNLAPDPPLPSNYGASAVYDPSTNQVYIKKVQSFSAYDPVANTHTQLFDLGFPPYWPRYAGGNPRGALDTKRGLIWMMGGGLYLVYDIANEAFVTDEWVTTGGGEFSNAATLPNNPEQWIETGGGDLIAAAAPGLDYDIKADAFVGWIGGSPYALDLATKTWTLKSADGSPPSPTSTGTYGRFRYIDAYNVFILVTSTDAVYFYKNTEGCG